MNQTYQTYAQKNDLPEIILIGINHKTAPVEIREKFSFTDETLKQFIAKARALCAEEIVYIATCNRVSIYYTAQSCHASLSVMQSLLAEFSGLSEERFTELLYKKNGKDAISHLFSVIASLDSMVLGENEIFNQIKAAYRLCVDLKSTGLLLNRLFHHAFSTGKRVRTETDIAKNPISIAYIAAEKAASILENLSGKKTLLIGAGEMGELILKYISKHDVEDIYLVNRSIDKAHMIALEINKKAHIHGLDDIPLLLQNIDIVISCATTDDYLVKYASVKNFMQERDRRPLVFIDIAVPRNIDPQVATISNVHVYNIDDLQDIATNNINNRCCEISRARDIIDEECENFCVWLCTLEMTPIINKLLNKFDEVRSQELEKYRRRKLKHLCPEDMAIIEELTKQIMTKTLHNPIMAIKKFQQVKSKRHIDLESIIEELFHR